MLDQGQKAAVLEHATDQHFQLQRSRRGHPFAVDRPPDLEPFLAGSERPDPGLEPVRHHQQLVVLEQRGDLSLVGLELRIGAPDRGVLVGGVLEFQHRQGQPVHEHHNVGPAVVLPFNDRELVDREPVVRGRIVEVDQPGLRPRDGSVGPAVLDVDPVPQQPMKGPVVEKERAGFWAEHLPERLFAAVFGNVGIELPDRGPEPGHEHHVAERSPLGIRLARGHPGAVADGVAEPLEPGQRRIFDMGLVEVALGFRGNFFKASAAFSKSASTGRGSASRSARYRAYSASAFALAASAETAPAWSSFFRPETVRNSSNLVIQACIVIGFRSRAWSSA